VPIATLQILSGRDDARKAALIAAVSRAISETLEAPLETVRVLIAEIPPAHWGAGGQTIKAIRKTKSKGS